LTDSNTGALNRANSERILDIENTHDLIAFLRSRGLLLGQETAEIRKLEGGVSSRTVLVRAENRPAFVVKQALSKLRVAVDWYSHPERIHREARGLEWLAKLAPTGTITPLLFEDGELHIIVMTAVPEPNLNWKAALLAGNVNAEYIQQFATVLATIHVRSAQQKELIRDVFADRSFFESLRLEPYYRYSAEQVPQTRVFFNDLIAETFQTQLALVHGDYSPKNVLIHDGRLFLVDHEVIHFGDPAFDVGFSLTHLLSKAHHLVHHRALFGSAACAYVNRYLECLKEAPWRPALEQRAVRHTLGCLLARVAGRSPLEYLTQQQRIVQTTVVLDLIADPPQTLTNLIADFSERLNAVD
jgi:5-methylthioribose kinase